jgi:proline dehydrogenase
MLRPLVYALSRSATAARIAGHAPGFRRISRRFVAGESRDDVVDVVRRLNAEGFPATVSFLGEDVAGEAEVRAAVAEFSAFATDIRDRRLRSHISVKLTQLGLAFDRDLAASALDEVLTAAGQADAFVRVDMEDSRYTDATLALVRDAHQRHPHCGAVVQAALRRSAMDVESLARAGVPVRLVKGAYREPPNVAFQRKADVEANFVRLARLYFERMTGDAWLAIATHDPRMVRAAQRAARELNMGAGRYEFQMLYGIRADLQRALRDAGERVRVYVPYGSHWYPYLMRRLAERPANLWFFLRNVLRR